DLDVAPAAQVAQRPTLPGACFGLDQQIQLGVLSVERRKLFQQSRAARLLAVWHYLRPGPHRQGDRLLCGRGRLGHNGRRREVGRGQRNRLGWRGGRRDGLGRGFLGLRVAGGEQRYRQNEEEPEQGES